MKLIMKTEIFLTSIIQNICWNPINLDFDIWSLYKDNEYFCWTKNHFRFRKIKNETREIFLCPTFCDRVSVDLGPSQKIEMNWEQRSQIFWGSIKIQNEEIFFGLISQSPNQYFRKVTLLYFIIFNSYHYSPV